MKAIILAGGENRRFQSHKALAEIKGRRIIEVSAELLTKHFTAVYISTNTPEFFFYLGLPLVGDIVEQRGPISGIYSSFISTGAPELFFMACDMPFIKPEVIELIKLKFHGQDAVLPVHKGLPQPLLGIYSRRIVPQLAKRIQQNMKAMWDLLQGITAQFIPEQEMLRVDPEGRSFVNINTLEEYRNLIVHI
jgi:molybdopterin-guanine dinucleotide biosynthesis protein A